MHPSLVPDCNNDGKNVFHLGCDANFLCSGTNVSVAVFAKVPTPILFWLDNFVCNPLRVYN